MPATTPCAPCCTTPQTVNIPGAVGPDGTPGTNGTNGVNAFTVTTANFVTPALSGSVTIQVANSSWMVIGQALVVADGTADGGTYVVTALPDTTHVTATYLNYPTNTNAGATVNSGAGVSPSGFQALPAVPLPIADGGTNSTTKGGAQTNLGLGQNAVVSNSTGLSQAVTASFVQVGTCAVSVTAAGEWLYSGFAVVDWVGVTFASSRTVTVKIRNTTQGVDLASTTYQTQNPTTTSFPSSALHVSFVLDATGVAADSVQLMITVSVINSAGTFQVTSGSLAGIPLRLT